MGEQTFRSILTRRQALRGVAMIGGVGAVGGAGLWYGSQPALAIEFAENGWNTDGDEITTHDGSIDTIDIDPEVTLDWKGFNDGTTDVDIVIEIPGDEGVLTGTDPIILYDETVTLDGTNGTRTVDLDPRDITGVEGVDKAEFEAEEDGSTKETAVTLELTVDPAEAAVSSTTETDTFTVVVHNEPADGTVSGSSSTTITSSEEVTNE